MILIDYNYEPLVASGALDGFIDLTRKFEHVLTQFKDDICLNIDGDRFKSIDIESHIDSLTSNLKNLQA
jgi:hypothetical protein